MSTPSQSALKTRRKINPLAQYLLALATMISGYSLYAMYAVPVLEGPPAKVYKRAVRARQVAEPRQDDKAWLQALLPADAWELESCKTLITSEGTILFRDYQPRADGYTDIYPFTLVMNAHPPDANLAGADGGDNDQKKSVSQPVVLRCLREAKLKFDRPLKLGMGGGRVKMESARLVGQVTVYRPESEPGKRDAISVVTSNIQIDETQIFTLEDVKFAFGSNYGHGRHLTIELSHSRPYRDLPYQFTHVTGVDRIELASLSHLRLEPTGDMQLDSKRTAVTATDKDDSFFSAQKVPLEISCAGHFAFDFTSNKASFKDQVLVEQIDQHRDSIRCDLLTLAFADKTDKSFQQQVAKESVIDDASPAAMRLKSFSALGSPAEIVSNSRRAKIMGDDVRFEVATRQFEARSRDRVVVVSPDYQVAARQLNYVLPKDRSMGPLDAVGPGRILRHATKDQDAFYLEWQKKLLVRRQNQQQVVSIDGGAKVRLGEDTHVQADRLKLWVSQVAATVPAQRGPTSQKKWNWNPAKLQTRGNVQIDSPQLSGTSQSLKAVWQVDEKLRQAAQAPQKLSGVFVTAQRHFVGRVPQTQEFANSSNGWANVSTSQPNQMIAQQGAIIQNRHAGNVGLMKHDEAIPNESGKKQRKLDFRGDVIDVILKQAGTKTEILDLQVDGNVEIVEAVETRDDDAPMKITGHHLRVVPQAEELYRLQVSGDERRMASLRANGLSLDGNEVYLDQVANKIWVEGAGTVSIDSSASPAKKRTSNLEASVQDRDLKVSFVAGMIFDGRKIYFEEDVAMDSVSRPDADGVVTKSRSFSEGLSIALANPVSFRNLTEQSKQPDVEVVEVVLVDHLVPSKRVFRLAERDPNRNATKLVSASLASSESLQTPIVIENQTYDRTGRLAEQQTVIVPQATFDARNGDIRAKGPGAILVHRLGGSGMLKPPGARPARRTRSDDQLTLIHVKFDGLLTANSKRKEMQIEGGVRSVTAPVKSVREVVDPDQDVSTWPAEAVKLICERVQFAQWTPQAANAGSAEASNEMIATGNAHITSSVFEATADRVSYNQANDMLVVEGTPRSDANLWFRQSPEARPDHLVAGKILYRLSDQWTEVQSVRNISVKAK